MNTTAAAVNQSTANTDKQQKQTAKEVIAANVQALIEQLEQGHSEALTASLTAMGRFHTYSFGNILETARQKPDATRVAGLYAWNQLGRKVKKGERGIRILTPVIGIRRKKDEEAEKDIRTQNQAVLVGFRAAYVFDVSQTEGNELPEFSERVSGSAGERSLAHGSEVNRGQRGPLIRDGVADDSDACSFIVCNDSQPALQSNMYRVEPIGGAELRKQVVHVIFDCAFADCKCFRNLAIAHSPDQQFQDFVLTVRQL